MELAEEEGVELAGVTDASVDEVAAYRDHYGLEFPILSGALETRRTWGVRLIWGNVVRLVDPNGRVVSEGREESARTLASRPSQ